MFDYENISAGIENNQRWYNVTSGKLPSITTVLGHTQSQEKIESLQRWRDSMGHEAADAYTNKAAAHGTNVHKLIEHYLSGEEMDFSDITDEDLDSMNAIKFSLKPITKIYGQEVALFSTFFRIAGRCDLVGEVNNIPTVVDFKTSVRNKSDADIMDYKLQLAFYAAAHNEMFNTEIKRGLVLMVTNTGQPLKFSFNVEDYYEDLLIRSNSFWQKNQ